MALSSEAVLEIHALYARAAITFDSGDADGFAECFTRDGAFTSGAKDPIAGRDDLREYAARRFRESRGLAHHVCDVLIEEDGEGVRGRAYGIILGPGEAGALYVRALGSYEDRPVEEDGRWRFASRTFTPRAVAGHVGRELIGPPAA